MGLKLWDDKKGEVIDFLDGEVEDEIYALKPTIRASDYSEWESKVQHRILMDVKEDKILACIFDGFDEEIGMPLRLCNGVY